jgi:Lrp/AsnC family leucine-responsive transcriptional regulator
MSKTLNQIDRKLIYELVQNSRQSYTQLGKKVKLSKQAVKERISNLENQNIILQYFALIDIHKMGYTFYRIDLRFQNVTEEKEKEIINYILKLQKVIWIAEIHGKWDLAVVFLTKDLVEVDDNIKKITWKYNDYIQNQTFSVATTHSRYSYGFIRENPLEEKEIFMGRELGNLELTNTEKNVLSILSKDARTSITEISIKIKKSISAIKNAMQNLKEKRIILGYSTLINLQKLGYQHYKLFINFKNPTQEKERKLEAYFKINPNIIFMTKSLGRSDIECELVVKSIEEFKENIRKLKREFNDLIKDIESYLIIKEHETNYYPI